MDALRLVGQPQAVELNARLVWVISNNHGKSDFQFHFLLICSCEVTGNAVTAWENNAQVLQHYCSMLWYSVTVSWKVEFDVGTILNWGWVKLRSCTILTISQSILIGWFWMFLGLLESHRQWNHLPHLSQHWLMNMVN